MSEVELIKFKMMLTDFRWLLINLVILQTVLGTFANCYITSEDAYKIEASVTFKKIDFDLTQRSAQYSIFLTLNCKVCYSIKGIITYTLYYRKILF